MKNPIKIMGTLATLLSLSALHAQGGFLMSGSINVTCTGALNIIVENGKWSNPSGTFTSGVGKVKFTGNAATANSTIEGGNTVFHEIEIAKSANDVRLVANNTTIKNYLVFNSGKLDLSTKALLLNTSADLSGESETSRTYGSTNGKVVKPKILNNPVAHNVGNMGMYFTVNGNAGVTTVSRFHPAQTLPTGSSIQKYWEVNAANPSGWSATLGFNYFEAELNGLDENLLVIWRSTDNGVTWTEMFASIRNTIGNYIELSFISDISGLWTLGTTTQPFRQPIADERSAREGLIATTKENDWTIYPNPVSDILNLAIISTTEQESELKVSDASGHPVFIKILRLTSGENLVSVETSNWQSGSYFAQLSKMSLTPIQFIKH